MSTELEILEPFNPEELSIGEQQQRYFAEPNGMLHNDYKDDVCLCQHKKVSIFSATISPICICDGFHHVIIPAKQDQAKIIGKWKKRQVKEKVSTEDQRVYNYIESISKM